MPRQSSKLPLVVSPTSIKNHLQDQQDSKHYRSYQFISYPHKQLQPKQHHTKPKPYHTLNQGFYEHYPEVGKKSVRKSTKPQQNKLKKSQQNKNKKYLRDEKIFKLQGQFEQLKNIEQLNYQMERSDYQPQMLDNPIFRTYESEQIDSKSSPYQNEPHNIITYYSTKNAPHQDPYRNSHNVRQQGPLIENLVNDQNQPQPQSYLPQELHMEKNQQDQFDPRYTFKADSIHPVFRQTLEYVDPRNFDLTQYVSKQSPALSSVSRAISRGSSSTGPRTNIQAKQTHKAKHRKYKQKYQKALQTINQLDSLNKTLLQECQQNYYKYQMIIQNIENLMVRKDQQIQKLNEFLAYYESLRNSRKLKCSDVSEQRQMKLQQNIKQLIGEIQLRDGHISQLEETLSQVQKKMNKYQRQQVQKSRKKQSQDNQLNRQLQSLRKKLKSVQQLNQIYEQKLRQKQKRIGKLSDFNSELQQQLLRLKPKNTENTNDTERSDLIVTFNRKGKEQEPIEDSGYQIKQYIENLEEQISEFKYELGFQEEKTLQYMPRNSSKEKLQIVPPVNIAQTVPPIDMRKVSHNKPEQLNKLKKKQEYLEQLRQLTDKFLLLKQSIQI